MLTQEELFDAIGALMAYDCGITNNWRKQADLTVKVDEYLDNTANPSGFLLTYIHERYSPKDGYILADVKEFIAWTEDKFGIYV